jgi:hypothetical protein
LLNRPCGGRRRGCHRSPARTEKPPFLKGAGVFNGYPGGDLLSHAVAHAVPSAQEGLTSVFGMETGVAPPPLPPGKGIRIVKDSGSSGRQKARPGSPKKMIPQSGNHIPFAKRLRLHPVRGQLNRESRIDQFGGNKPHGLLVPVSFMRYRTSTSGLSTS